METLESSILGEVGGLAVALVATALFSFIETSVTALKYFELKEIGKRNPRYKGLIHLLEHNPRVILITILIGASLANTTAAALASILIEDLFVSLNFSAGVGLSIGVGTASLLLMIFGEIIPKNFARTHGSSLVESFLWFLQLVYLLCYPLVTLLNRFSNVIIDIMTVGTPQRQEHITSEQEVEFLIEYINENKLMEPQKSAMLRNILRLGNTTVNDILVPEHIMVTISADTSLREAFKTFAKCQFSRLPVYEGEKENIIGIMYQKDIIMHVIAESDIDAMKVRDVVRPVLFVPQSLKVNQLLRDFREKQLHMAIVLTERGDIAGLVTLEDALEEIVGEINDEHEPIVSKIEPLQENEWLLDATIELDDLQSLLGIEFKDTKSVTLGGFMTEQLQHLPQVDELLVYEGYSFKIHKISPKQVLQVLVWKELLPQQS